jgi:hypothetical protein
MLGIERIDHLDDPHDAHHRHQQLDAPGGGRTALATTRRAI